MSIRAKDHLPPNMTPCSNLNFSWAWIKCQQQTAKTWVWKWQGNFKWKPIERNQVGHILGHQGSFLPARQARSSALQWRYKSGIVPQLLAEWKSTYPHLIWSHCSVKLLSRKSTAADTKPLSYFHNCKDLLHPSQNEIPSTNLDNSPNSCPPQQRLSYSSFSMADRRLARYRRGQFLASMLQSMGSHRHRARWNYRDEFYSHRLWRWLQRNNIHQNWTECSIQADWI